MTEHLNNGVTRRRLLATSLAGGAAFAVGGLAACFDDSSSTTTAVSVGPRKPGGTLLTGLVGSGDDTMDAHVGFTEGNVLYAKALYAGLLRFDHRFVPDLELAEEMTPASDAKSWTVRLRDGVTFSNGKPITADDVIFTIRRILDPKLGATAALLLESIDLKGLRKVDERTVELGLKYADVTLKEAFAKASTGIVPVGYDPKKPVGAGPFKIHSFDPGRRVVFEKNDDYHRSGTPYLDELVFVIFSDASASFNALNSGAVDAAGRVAIEYVPVAQQSPNLQVVESKTSSFETIVMRCDEGPFKDARVRQAMKALVDREQIIDQVYSGRARLGNDLPALDDPMYDTSIPQRTQDLEQARSLLEDAGFSDLKATFYTRPDDPFLLPQAQVFAQQANEIGVDIKIQNVADVGQFYSKYFGQTDLQSDAYFSTPLWNAYAYGMAPTGPYNTAAWVNPMADKLYTEARGTLDAARRKELLAQAQQIFWEDGGWIIPAFPNSYDALNTQFTGIVPDPSGGGVNGGYFDEISLAA